LEKRNIRVIVFLPHLRLGFNPRACFTTPMRRTSRDCTFTLDERMAIARNFEPLVTSISLTNPRVLFFYQNDMFCVPEKCSMLLALMIAVSFAELVSIGAVLPFLAVLSSPRILFEHPAAQPLIRALGAATPDQLLLPLTLGFALAALLAGAMRLALLWSSTR